MQINFYACIIIWSLNNKRNEIYKYIFSMVKIQSQIRDLIVKEILNGEKQAHVARKLYLGKTTVRHIQQKYLKTGDVSDAKRSGRPMKTTLRKKDYCTEFQRWTIFDSKEVVNEANMLGKVSICTVKRYLCTNNFHVHVASKKPLLNSIQIKKSILWCKTYSSFTATNWSRVIFSEAFRKAF